MGDNTTRNSIIILVLAAAFLAYLSWKPSTSSIAEEMVFDEAGQITYDGHRFEIEWEDEVVEVRGDLRLKERFYNKNIPIITWTFVVTTGEYSDPALVKIKSHGDGSLRWEAPRQPKGTFMAYSLVAKNAKVDSALHAVEEGSVVFLEGRLSRTGRITGDGRPLAQISNTLQKFILLDAAGIVE